MSVLQLRIELLHIEPLIWRRLQVPGNYTFWDLHVAIQSAFAGTTRTCTSSGPG